MGSNPGNSKPPPKTSILDKVDFHVTVPDRKYKPALNQAVWEAVSELRDRANELQETIRQRNEDAQMTRDTLALARSHIEAAQIETRRKAEREARLEKQVDFLQAKLEQLGSRVEQQAALTDQSDEEMTDPDKGE